MNQNSIDPRELRQQFIELMKLQFKDVLEDVNFQAGSK